MIKTLHAGSMTGELLILYPLAGRFNIKGEYIYMVKILDDDIRWDLYCNDVTIEDIDGVCCTINNNRYSYWTTSSEGWVLSSDPMETCSILEEK